MKMVKNALILLLVLATVSLSFAGCGSETITSEYSVWEDVYEVVSKETVSKDTADTTDKTSSTPADKTSSKANDKTSSKTDDKANSNADVGGNVKGSYFPKRNVTEKTLRVYWGGSTKEVPQYIKKATEIFEKAYNCKVEYINGSWNSRLTELTQYANVGKLPDAIIGLVKTDFPLFASSGLLSEIGKDEFDFSNELVDKNTTDNVLTWYNKTYAIGAYDEPEVVIYNKTLIESMGYETPAELYKKGKWTWDEMRKLAKNMSQDTDKDGVNDIYGFGCWGMDGLMASNNTWYLNRKSDNSITLNFSSNPVREGYQLIYDMYHTDHSIVPGLYDGLDSIKNGTLAMYIERSHYLFRIQDANSKYKYDFAPIPKGPSADTNYRLTLPWALAVGNGSNNREGALAYIEIILSIFADQSKVGPKEDPTQKYSAAQQKLIAEIRNFKAAPMVSTGYGKFNNLLLGLNNSIRGENIPYASAIDSVKSSMENEIKMSMTAF